ncbi:unnamed protein product, partial [Symbiodinium sp. CCMP2456]
MAHKVQDWQVLETALQEAEVAGVAAELLEKSRKRLQELQEAEARTDAAAQLQAATAAADAALHSTTPEEGFRSAIEDLGRALRRAETCE